VESLDNRLQASWIENGKDGLFDSFTDESRKEVFLVQEKINEYSERHNALSCVLDARCL